MKNLKVNNALFDFWTTPSNFNREIQKSIEVCKRTNH